MVATLSGAALLFFGLLAIAITWHLSYEGTIEALDATSEGFRKAKAQELSEQIAVIIRPTWNVARQLADRLRIGTEQDGYTVFPPTPETFADPAQLLAFHKALTSYVNWENFLRKTSTGLKEAEHNNFVGVVMMLALDAKNQPSEGLDTCSKVVVSANILDPSMTKNYMVDVMFLDPARSVSDPMAQNAGVSREMRMWDPVRLEMGEPFATPSLDHPCTFWMAPLWGGHPQLEEFYNFTWYGPRNPGVGWGNLFQGTVPIYDGQKRQIGRASTIVSMGKSIAPLLQDIIDSSSMSRGGAAALFTESGVILGLSEAAASATEVQAETLGDLVVGSMTGNAVAEVEAFFGIACPEEEAYLTFDDHLVDVKPFSAMEHGLPPLPERWCQMLTVPRQNIYDPIDAAMGTMVIVGVTCLIAFSWAVALLGTSLGLAIRAQRGIRRESIAADWAIVREAEECITKLSCPMVLVRATDFLAETLLESYEEWRDRGKAKVLDSMKKVKGFKAAGNLIVFISHQWLGHEHPDTPDNKQLHVMQAAVAQFVANEPGKNIYVWLDYISIAQDHEECQAMAVSSLPVYVSLVDFFVICAPEARHQSSFEPVGLASYYRRAWCRAELLAKVCSSGLQNMFVCTTSDGSMKRLTAADMDDICLSVYEGDFTIKRDAEKLVVPILGLYSLILKQSHLAGVQLGMASTSSSAHSEVHMQSIRAHIEQNKDIFFPYSYNVMEEGRGVSKKLFGDLIEMMEEHISTSFCPASPSSRGRSPQFMDRG